MITEFFANVPRVRRYLNRHQQDPMVRKERLATLAHELARPRMAQELAQFLVNGLGMAVGGGGASLYQRATPEPLFRWGQSLATLPESIWQEADAAPMAGPPFVKRVERNLVVAVRGSVRVLAILWLEQVLDLDDGSLRLIGALADTAGMQLEIQGFGSTRRPPP